MHCGVRKGDWCVVVTNVSNGSKEHAPGLRAARLIEHAWLWHVAGYPDDFESSAPSSVDLIHHVDRMMAESTDTGDPPPRCGIVSPPFRFLIRPRPSDFRQACLG